MKMSGLSLFPRRGTKEQWRSRNNEVVVWRDSSVLNFFPVFFSSK